MSSQKGKAGQTQHLSRETHKYLPSNSSKQESSIHPIPLEALLLDNWGINLSFFRLASMEASLLMHISNCCHMTNHCQSTLFQHQWIGFLKKALWSPMKTRAIGNMHKGLPNYGLQRSLIFFSLPILGQISLVRLSFNSKISDHSQKNKPHSKDRKERWDGFLLHCRWVTLCEWLRGFIFRFGILGSMSHQGVCEIMPREGGCDWCVCQVLSLSHWVLITED